MPAFPASGPSPSQDGSRAALDFVHGMLGGDDQAALDLPDLLAGLAGAFHAAGAGVASLADGTPLARHPASADASEPVTRWPWQERPELLRQPALETGAVLIPLQGARGLLTAVAAPDGDAGWLLWLEDRLERTWTRAEGAALSLAVHALSRGARRTPSPGDWARRLEHRTRQQRLEQAATVTRRLSHDFNNVLTGIQGFTELALAQIPVGAPTRGHLDEVYQSLLLGTAMTSQLRLFSRRNAPSPRPAALAQAFAEEEARLRPTWAPTVRLDVRLPADLPEVGVAAEPLRALLAQLLLNACEAITGRGTVTVAARLITLTAADCASLLGNASAGPHVEVTISDEGPGLGEEARQKLWAEPFFTNKPRHRGLGLAVAYGVLHAHRGGLALEPGPGGKGTTARVVLPVAAGSPAPRPLPDRTTASASAGGERVLIVDDDPIILRLCCTTLERAGYHVQTAASGPEALRSYTGSPERFRLVVSDVVMPRMTGVDLARKLHSHDAEVNVLFMSGQGSTDLDDSHPAEGTHDFLAKPFRPEGLLKAVRTALDRGPRRAAATARSAH